MRPRVSFPSSRRPPSRKSSRRTQAADFDPSSRFYAEENGKVVGYATLAANGRVSYPWCLKGQEAAAEPLFQAVLNGLKQRGVTSAFAAYRGDWPVTKDFFQTRGFRLVREMVNFIIDIVEMPTPAARPSLPFSPLRREDVPTLFELTPEALRVRTRRRVGETPVREPVLQARFAVRAARPNRRRARGNRHLARQPRLRRPAPN